MERVIDLLGQKVVLLTGTTGFVGKVYLEKLLRSCPDVTVRVIARGGGSPSHRELCRLCQLP
ncbi:MAG: SDR family oxidoreductase [Hahellaceae bacterium]|nr:SDR family oxidoreductase [Hahellaceae bacterium]